MNENPDYRPYGIPSMREVQDDSKQVSTVSLWVAVALCALGTSGFVAFCCWLWRARP